MTDSALDQDFLDHLAAIVGEGPEAALALLGDWLVNYRPKQRYELNVLSPVQSATSSLSIRAA